MRLQNVCVGSTLAAANDSLFTSKHQIHSLVSELAEATILSNIWLRGLQVGSKKEYV
jgi:hypothetical protein